MINVRPGSQVYAPRFLDYTLHPAILVSVHPGVTAATYDGQRIECETVATVRYLSDGETKTVAFSSLRASG